MQKTQDITVKTVTYAESREQQLTQMKQLEQEMNTLIAELNHLQEGFAKNDYSIENDDPIQAKTTFRDVTQIEKTKDEVQIVRFELLQIKNEADAVQKVMDKSHVRHDEKFWGNVHTRITEIQKKLANVAPRPWAVLLPFGDWTTRSLFLSNQIGKLRKRLLQLQQNFSIAQHSIVQQHDLKIDNNAKKCETKFTSVSDVSKHLETLATLESLYKQTLREGRGHSETDKNTLRSLQTAVNLLVPDPWCFGTPNLTPSTPTLPITQTTRRMDSALFDAKQVDALLFEGALQNPLVNQQGTPIPTPTNNPSLVSVEPTSPTVRPRVITYLAEPMVEENALKTQMDQYLKISASLAPLEAQIAQGFAMSTSSNNNENNDTMFEKQPPPSNNETMFEKQPPLLPPPSIVTQPLPPTPAPTQQQQQLQPPVVIGSEPTPVVTRVTPMIVPTTLLDENTTPFPQPFEPILVSNDSEVGRIMHRYNAEHSFKKLPGWFANVNKITFMQNNLNSNFNRGIYMGGRVAGAGKYAQRRMSNYRSNNSNTKPKKKKPF